jgi:hypothetical protein
MMQLSRSIGDAYLKYLASESPAATYPSCCLYKGPPILHAGRGGRSASGGADGEARPAADLASPSRCHKPPEESAASRRLRRHDARKLIADVHTYAPPTRGLQTCCCAEGHGEDHPLHHQEETDATFPLHRAMYRKAPLRRGAGHLRRVGGPANHRPKPCPRQVHHLRRQSWSPSAVRQAKKKAATPEETLRRRAPRREGGHPPTPVERADA